MNINKITEIMNRNPRKILDKSECYLLYEAGIFGNKALTWKSYDEIIKSGWRNGVCMRSKKGVARKEVRYNLKCEEVNGRCAQITLIRNMNFDSYADLEKLLETFPTSVVEFSTYSIPVGNRAITGRDTVFWEV